MINAAIKVAKLAGGYGISTMLTEAAKCFTPANASKFTKVCTAIGTFGVGLVVEEQVEKSVNRFVKECTNLKDDFKNLKEEVKKEQEEKSKKEQA